MLIFVKLLLELVRGRGDGVFKWWVCNKGLKGVFGWLVIFVIKYFYIYEF